MASTGPIGQLIQFVLPKRRPNERGLSTTNTFQPTNTGTVLAVPQYREHLTDVFESRAANDSNELLSQLFRQDSDFSAAVNAYLTVADTPMNLMVHDLNGEVDRDGLQTAHALLTVLGTRHDYSKGFQLKPGVATLNERMRYMLLLRGAISNELLFNKQFVPTGIRMVDPATLRWYEGAAGDYKPVQLDPATSNEISLDIPNFFVSFYRQDPNTIYTYSPFVSAINLVAARQQVINDLYRIIQRNGFPRLEVTVIEEVIRKNAPPDVRTDEAKMRTYIQARITEITNAVNNMRADSTFVHTDAIETDVLNKEGPKNSMDVSSVIDVLNQQNQAALKTMATIVGRGSQGVNTGTVEARVFSLNAEQINKPIEEFWSQALTLALRLTGSESVVSVKFSPVEMRAATELEPMLTVKQTRLMEALSHGTITDDEYHMEMHGRPRPDSAPELSGTGFYGKSANVDTDSVSPNSDPLGRSVTPDGSENARSNQVKK